MSHDAFIDGLRRAGLLIEFSDDEWRAYARKHFGPGSPSGFSAHAAFVSERADADEVRWREPQRREYPRNRYEQLNDWDDGK